MLRVAWAHRAFCESLQSPSMTCVDYCSAQSNACTSALVTRTACNLDLPFGGGRPRPALVHSRRTLHDKHSESEILCIHRCNVRITDTSMYDKGRNTSGNATNTSMYAGFRSGARVRTQYNNSTTHVHSYKIMNMRTFISLGNVRWEVLLHSLGVHARCILCETRRTMVLSQCCHGVIPAYLGSAPHHRSRTLLLSHPTGRFHPDAEEQWMPRLQLGRARV